MKLITLGFLVFLSIAKVEASLIDSGTYITDTETGYEWLHLRFTSGKYYHEIVEETKEGGSLEGWEIAGIPEIFTLFDAAGGDGLYPEINMEKTYGHTSLIETLGSHWGSLTHSYMDIPPTTSIVVNTKDATPGGSSTGFFLKVDSIRYQEDSLVSPRFAPAGTATALYRVRTVSESSVFFLFILGLIGLLWKRYALRFS